VNYRWDNLYTYYGENLLGYYQEMLTHLGATADNQTVRDIYAFPTTVFSHSENLRAVLDGIEKINWHDIDQDSIGVIYEGLLAKNSEDSRSGAGQYFTPRPLVECIVSVMYPKAGEVIQDPATGTGGFLIAADRFIKRHTSKEAYQKNPPRYQGMEIERGTHRLCLMNTFLHSMNADIYVGDALTDDSLLLSRPSVIFANPPFGAKAGSARVGRTDLSFSSSNKQISFLQHIYTSLQAGGRAAVVVPDNVLFEEGIGRSVRQELMQTCDLHTVLRLPTGIFYAQGVKTNVLFFSKRPFKSSEHLPIWFYDLRTNMPRFGKKNPLSLHHFDEFIDAFGSDPLGRASNRADIIDDRFRSFTREQIAENGDSLDLTWLRDNRLDDLQSELEPEEIVAEMVRLLTVARAQMEELQANLADVSEAI
jgi:type I restriction enzyme M protein